MAEADVMESFESGNLRIAVREVAPDRIRLDWHGRSDDRRPSDSLMPFFDGLLSRAQAGSSLLEMHFEDLEYFNSSTITVLIRLAQKAAEQDIRMRMSYDADLVWQRVSFDALKVFEKQDGLLEVRPASDAR